VWSNEQIINYWDSLLRGYPTGIMFFHRVTKIESANGSKARDKDDITCEANEGDWLLIDGQQRMAAVLLAFGEGRLQDDRKLWVDFGTHPKDKSGLRFQLRITSTGQPFGYEPDRPNTKFELRKRQDKWLELREQFRDDSPGEVFQKLEGDKLIDVKCAVSFSEVCNSLAEIGADKSVATFAKRQDALEQIARDFIEALESVLKSRVVLQEIDSKIMSEPDELIRFFGRIGQGGTRLSDDELTYSIIKHQYPNIHDQITDIMDGPGRIIGEVDLVLAALRTAKAIALADDKDFKEWDIIGRPNPASASKLVQKVRLEFTKLIPEQRDGPANLKIVLENLRRAVSYDKKECPDGLPPILLARLPKQLVEIIIFFSVKRGVDCPWDQDASKILRAFMLHWLLFVGNDDKAAWHAFACAIEAHWTFCQASISGLVLKYENEGIARYLARKEAWPGLRAEVEMRENPHEIREWAKRFIAADRDRKPGEALRVLSTNNELIKRALMWLQRDYIIEKFPNYDPTSGRDEDLPIDLDHIVPHALFGFDWRYKEKRLEPKAISDNFRWQIGTLGNSLGNFRWIAASDNRKKGKGPYEPLSIDGQLDLVSNPDHWNKVIPQDNRPWTIEDIADFQRMVDLRTLDLYERILTGSGIENILPTDNSSR